MVTTRQHMHEHKALKIKHKPAGIQTSVNMRIGHKTASFAVSKLSQDETPPQRFRHQRAALLRGYAARGVGHPPPQLRRPYRQAHQDVRAYEGRPLPRPGPLSCRNLEAG